MTTDNSHIVIQNLTMAYGDFVVMRDLNFAIQSRDIFIIMGGSGCGKSTLMRSMVGLKSPDKGRVLYGDVSFWDQDPVGRELTMRRFGILYQSGALWSSMTLAGFEDFYPSEISGGMRKRAGLVRAMALDPDILFFDDPSAGLDPVGARRLDDLILEMRDSLGTTIVVVTHELASIFAIGNNSVFLDADTKTMIAQGDPKKLLAECEDLKVREFPTRGERN